MENKADPRKTTDILAWYDAFQILAVLTWLLSNSIENSLHSLKISPTSLVKKWSYKR